MAPLMSMEIVFDTVSFARKCNDPCQVPVSLLLTIQVHVTKSNEYIIGVLFLYVSRLTRNPRDPLINRV